MNAHPTEGPWRISEQNDDETTIVGPNHLNDEECEYIATVNGLGTDETNIGHANARLIAASPLLLASVEDFLTLYDQGQLQLEGDNGGDPIIDAARNALAAARGE